MVGSWEKDSAVHLLIGISHTWMMHPDWAWSLIRLNKSVEGKKTKISYSFQHDAPYDLARNKLAQECLDSGADYLYMVDSDMVIPSYALEQLYSHKLPIVGALYYRRHPNSFPLAFRFKPGSTQLDPIPQHELRPGLNEVDGMGMGCTLIHRRVFETLRDNGHAKELSMPSEGTTYKIHEFFKFAATEPPYVSEDLWFCIAARQAGFRLYIDTNVSCGHILSTMIIKNGTPQWSPLETGRGSDGI